VHAYSATVYVRHPCVDMMDNTQVLVRECVSLLITSAALLLLTCQGKTPSGYLGANLH
jgi:hypothetical protein